MLKQAEELKGFLTEVCELMNPVVARMIDRHLPPRRQTTVFFGAGKAGLQLLKICRDHGREVNFFCDNDVSLQGSKIEGLTVLKPEELAGINDLNLIITTAYASTSAEIQAQLISAGLPADRIHDPHQETGDIGYSFQALLEASLYAGDYSKNFPKIQKAFSFLGDDRSRLVYLNTLRSRCLPSPALAGLVTSGLVDAAQYWVLPEFQNIREAVYLDCGAYIGDTIASFLYYNDRASVRKIYAFEPVLSIYETLLRNADILAQAAQIDRSKIDCRNCLVGEATTGRAFLPRSVSGRMLSKLETEAVEAGFTGEDRLEVISIDDLLAGEPVSIIKADVEGYEIQMLKGAASSIKTHRPKLAISLYHRASDYYEIPLYLKTLVPEYKMAVRHHSLTAFETILYCWI